MAALVQVGPG